MFEFKKGIARRVFFKISLVFVFLMYLLFNSTCFVFGKDSQSLEIFFFYKSGCPHCAAEEKFLEELLDKYPELEIKSFSVYDKRGIQLLQELYQTYQVPAHLRGLVPATFVGDRYFIGFSKSEEEEIKNYILSLREEINLEDQSENTTKVPFLGKVDLSKFSLPVLALSLIHI